jgi:hypothetical protein
MSRSCRNDARECRAERVRPAVPVRPSRRRSLPSSTAGGSARAGGGEHRPALAPVLQLLRQARGIPRRRPRHRCRHLHLPVPGASRAAEGRRGGRRLRFGEPSAVGIDGCGAPVFALSLTGLARAIGRVIRMGCRDGELPQRRRERGLPMRAKLAPSPKRSSPTRGRSKATADRIRPSSTLGVFAKGGAEGVIVMATRSGYAVAVKCLDGSSRATGTRRPHPAPAGGSVRRRTGSRLGAGGRHCRRRDRSDHGPGHRGHGFRGADERCRTPGARGRYCHNR